MFSPDHAAHSSFLHSRSLPDHSEEKSKDSKWPSPGEGGEGMLPWMENGASAGGSTTNSRPKTIKEYEEELVELRRDNYDLRMRIYLMEEQDECCSNLSSLDQMGASSKLPPSFAQLKELYISNTQLKDEIGRLKNQLVEKEELILQAASAVESLEKTQMEKLEKIKLDAEKECQRLQDTISQLLKEVMELKDNRPPSENAKSEKSALFDDSNVMYAMAFGLPLPSKAGQTHPLQEESEKIFSLQLQLAKLEKNMEEESSRRLSCDEKLDKVRMDLKEAEDSRRHLSDQLRHREAELAKAHRIIEEKCQTVSDLEDKLARFPKTSKDLLQTEKRFHQGSDDSKITISSFSEFQDQVNQLREQLKAQKVENIRIQGENMKAMKTIKGLVKQNKALTRDLESYVSNDVISSKNDMAGESSTFSKDNRITELEAEVSVLKDKLSAISFGGHETSSDVAMLKLELESKNSEIENLNEELKKRTFNLQELVNKELWDKNREIEKLNQIFERKQSEMNSLKQELNGKNQELAKLQDQIKRTVCIQDLPLKDFEFKENTNPNLPIGVIIDEKLRNELKMTVEDNQRLKEEIEVINKNLSHEICLSSKLKEDCLRWKKTAEESEKNRKELINACTLLTTRLEELSMFLESLLPSLGSKKRRMLQQAIDRSREMSRSFSFVDQSSLSLSIPLLPDVSQVDFCSGDETLMNLGDKVAVGSSENDEVTRLRNQVESLVEKLKVKEQSPDMKRSQVAGVWNIESDERLDDITAGSILDSLSEISGENIVGTPGRKRASLAIVALPAVPEKTLLTQPVSPHPVQTVLSESDGGGWSEPDRNVSKERIGISDVVTLQKPNNSSEESSRSNKKVCSGKKSRNEGLLELKRLSAKLDCLEQMNEALHAELQVLHRANTSRLEENNAILSKPNSPKSLRDIVNSRRRSLEKSMNIDSLFESEKSKCPETDALSEKIKEISVQLECSCRRCLELEEKCISLESERKCLESRLTEVQDKLKVAQNNLDQALSTMKEKDNYLLEKQCALLEANNNNILLNAKLETITENINMKQDMLEKYEHELAEKDEKSREMFKEMEELRKQSEAFESELKSRLESCQREVEEAVSRRLETERRLIESYEVQTDLRTRLDQEILRSKDLENQNKHEERSWRRRLTECESLHTEREAELRRKLDTAVLTTSEAVLERTRLANDKLKLQQDLRAKETTHFSVMKELEHRVAELETLNSELEAAARCKWEVRQEPLGARSPPGPRSPTGLRSPIAARSPIGALSPPLSPRSPRPVHRPISNTSSDYVSDQEHPFQVNANLWLSGNQGRRNNNSSPDLGIESDHHSLAACGSKLSSLDPLPITYDNGYVAKLKAENENLHKHLFKTRKALADTLSQLTSANQKKQKFERDIYKEIYKTNSVLQKARVNFEQNENQPPRQ